MFLALSDVRLCCDVAYSDSTYLILSFLVADCTRHVLLVLVFSLTSYEQRWDFLI